MKFKPALHELLRITKHPYAIRLVLNHLPVDINIATGEEVTIGRGCRFQGQISLSNHVSLGGFSRIEGDVSVGRWTNLEDSCEIFGKVDIGSFCAIARNNVFQQTNHEMVKPAIQMRFYNTVLGSELNHTEKGPITVGNDVWIGTRCIILSGVEVGNGAVIGAGSIVTDDVEPYSIVAGVPAEPVGQRFSEDIIQELEEIKWWNWDVEKIKSNKEFFETDLTNADSLADYY